MNAADAIAIHRVADDGWRELRDLRLRALADAPDAFGSTLERERVYGRDDWLGWVRGWPGSENAALVAVDAGRWVGMAVGSRPLEHPTAHLYAMWVAPAARRRGAGRALVDAVVAWAAASGATSIELGVTETNRGAVAFYEGCGFAPTGATEPLREGSELRLLVMRRPLAA